MVETTKDYFVVVSQDILPVDPDFVKTYLKLKQSVPNYFLIKPYQVAAPIFDVL